MSNEADDAQQEIDLVLQMALEKVKCEIENSKWVTNKMCVHCEENKVHIHDGYALTMCLRCLDENQKGYYVTRIDGSKFWRSYTTRCQMDVHL